jgi:arylsulfatase A
MKRPMKLLCFLSLAGYTLICGNVFSQQKRKTAPAKQPNIVLIVADDMGIGDLGVYGQTKIHTPYLDGMAASGMRFSQFYAGCPVCAPSRAALMTGQHTGNTPIRGNKEIEPEGQWPLPDSTITIAKVLKKAGYATGDFGKWGLGFVGTSGDPVNQGFDTFFGYNCQRQSHNYYPDHLWQNDTRVDFPNNWQNKQQYAPAIIQERALSFLDANKEKPFFLYLTYTLPHAALQVPADSTFENYKKQFNETPQPIKLPWNGQGYEPQAYPKAAYASMVTLLDRYVGQVLQKLKDLGLEENTLVIFTSDNGPHREGGNNPAFFNSSAGFRGIKRDMYEGGIREPLIARWPGKIQAGSTSTHIGAFWDFLPTFAALAHTKAPAYINGISFLPALTGQKGQAKHPYLYWEFHEDGGKQAVRMGSWKGIRLNAIKAPRGTISLYNLEKDRTESTDLASQYPEVVKQITRIMENARTENRDFPFWP